MAKIINATVVQIDNNLPAATPFVVGFATDAIIIGGTVGSDIYNSFILFEGKKYYCEETEDALISEANSGLDDVEDEIDPSPPTMTITLEDIGSPITLGAFIDFSVHVDQTPSAALQLHLFTPHGNNTYTMTNFGGGNWGYNGWESYYSAPTWDVDETLEYYVTGMFQGNLYTSQVLFSDGV